MESSIKMVDQQRSGVLSAVCCIVAMTRKNDMVERFEKNEREA